MWGRNNDDRAEAAYAALRAYIATNSPPYANEPIEDQVGDLLCDLLHLVRRDGERELTDGTPQSDPTYLLDRARTNFEEEEAEEKCFRCGAKKNLDEGYDGHCLECIVTVGGDGPRMRE